MQVTFLFLAILSIVSILLIYIVGKFFLKKDISLKNIAIPVGMSGLLSFASSFILVMLFYKFDMLGQRYIIPIFAIILFAILSLILFKTKAKLRNSVVIILVALLLPLLYNNSSKDTKFLCNVNRTDIPFKRIDTKVQNEYLILLQNQSETKQEISFQILNDKIKIVKPNSVIHLEPSETIRVKLLLESNFKDIKFENIKIKVSNRKTKVIRKSIFMYKY